MHRDAHSRTLEVASRDNGGATRAPSAPDARSDPFGVHLLHSGRLGPHVYADLGRRGRGSEDHHITIDVGNIAHLEVRAGDRLVADEEALGAVAVGGPHHRSVRQPRRYAGDDVDPRVIGILAYHRRLTRRGVHLEDPHGALIAALHHDEQAVFRPVHGGHVLESGAIPLHVLRGRAVDADEMQCDLGVGGSRRRICDRHRRARRIGGIGDVPAMHARDVDASDQQARSIRRPPVPTLTGHLLGGDELGEAIGDLVVFRAA